MTPLRAAALAFTVAVGSAGASSASPAAGAFEEAAACVGTSVGADWPSA